MRILRSLRHSLRAKAVGVPKGCRILRAQKPGWEQYLWDIWISRGDALWPVLGTIGRALGDSPGKGMLASVKAMGKKTSMAPWINVREYDNRAKGQTILYFAGCTARRVRPEWVAKSQTILKGLGYNVARTKEECCGGTLLSAGLHSSAIKAMRSNIQTWRDVGRPAIATACTSCQYALANYVDQKELF